MNRATLTVRLWSFVNVFVLWFVKPTIVEVNEKRCVVRSPLNWRTRRRDIHAMYLGVLCMGADIAAGLIAFNLVREKKIRVSFIFKDLHAEFLKDPAALAAVKKAAATLPDPARSFANAALAKYHKQNP